MSNPRLIRIEAIRFEALSGSFVGTAILRREDGALTHHRRTVPGDPAWTHSEAFDALAAA